MCRVLAVNTASKRWCKRPQSSLTSSVSGSGVFGAADYAEAIQGIRTSRRPEPALV